MSVTDRTDAVKMIRDWFCDNPDSPNCCNDILLEFLKFKNIDKNDIRLRNKCKIFKSVNILLSIHKLLSKNSLPEIEYSRSFDTNLLDPIEEDVIQTKPTKLLQAVRWMYARRKFGKFIYAHGTTAITMVDIEPIFVFSDVVCCTVPANYTFEYDYETMPRGVQQYNRICFLTNVHDSGPIDKLMAKIPVVYKYTVMPIFSALQLEKLNPTSTIKKLPNPHVQEHDSISSLYTSISTLSCKDSRVFYKIINLTNEINNRDLSTCIIARELYTKWYVVQTPENINVHETVYQISLRDLAQSIVISIYDDTSYSYITTCTRRGLKFSIIWKYRCRVYGSDDYIPDIIDTTSFGDKNPKIKLLDRSDIKFIENIEISKYLYTRPGLNGIIEVCHKNLLHPVGYIFTKITNMDNIILNTHIPLSIKLFTLNIKNTF